MQKVELTDIYTIVFYTTDMPPIQIIQRLWCIFNLKVPDWPNVARQTGAVFICAVEPASWDSQRVGIAQDQLALNLFAMSFELQILLFQICFVLHSFTTNHVNHDIGLGGCKLASGKL